MAKKTHGGKRNGSGRKPSGKKQITLRLKPETIMRIRETAKAFNTTQSEAVEFALSQLDPGFVCPAKPRKF